MNLPENKQCVQTGDGSHTLYRADIDEHYHSTFGAINESAHVFIDNGLRINHSNPVHLFEVGFGTGLNALLTLNYAIKHNISVFYDTVELFPIGVDAAKTLNYPQLIDKTLQPYFDCMHDCKWDTDVKISDEFVLRKIQANITTLQLVNNKYNVVYFDAFSPEKQPEMWSQEVFLSIYNSMKTGGIITTYCSKGIVKRTLREVGFTVERLQGPTGKRHMVRGIKTMNNE
jgi:tRNA U34 5-methylaminomethyl-2-thiouridine-forming methyltransferase MnmC